MALPCLHCEISDLLQRRQAAGEQLDTAAIGKFCQVLADIAASEPHNAAGVFSCARGFLDRFERDIAAGTYRNSLLTRQPEGHA